MERIVIMTDAAFDGFNAYEVSRVPPTLRALNTRDFGKVLEGE